MFHTFSIQIGVLQIRNPLAISALALFRIRSQISDPSFANPPKGIDSKGIPSILNLLFQRPSLFRQNLFYLSFLPKTEK